MFLAKTNLELLLNNPFVTEQDFLKDLEIHFLFVVEPNLTSTSKKNSRSMLIPIDKEVELMIFPYKRIIFKNPIKPKTVYYAGGSIDYTVKDKNVISIKLHERASTTTFKIILKYLEKRSESISDKPFTTNISSLKEASFSDIYNWLESDENRFWYELDSMDYCDDIDLNPPQYQFDNKN